MFNSTFANCYILTGSIPSGLFGNISGTPATHMFRATFMECRGLEGGDVVIPASVTLNSDNVETLTHMMSNMWDWEGQLFWGTNVIHTVITPSIRISSFIFSTKMPGYADIHTNWK